MPALAALLAHPQLSYYARYGLEPNPDPSADDALREALRKLKGRLLVGALQSVALRKDAKAAASVAGLLYDTDPEVSHAAAAALGAVRGVQAAKALEEGLGKTKGGVRTGVAAAGLVCAAGLLAQGDRTRALALYTNLARSDVSKPVRLAAMHAIIAAETSLNRPRAGSDTKQKRLNRPGGWLSRFSLQFALRIRPADRCGQCECSRCKRRRWM